MSTHSNGISALAGPERARDQDLPQALRALAHKLRASMVDPELQPVDRAWSEIDEARPVRSRTTILAPDRKDAADDGHDARVRARSNSWTETSQAACGWPSSVPPTAWPTSRTLRRNRRLDRPTPSQGPGAAASSYLGPRRSPKRPWRREDRRSKRPAVDPLTSYHNLQRIGASASTTGCDRKHLQAYDDVRLNPSTAVTNFWPR